MPTTTSAENEKRLHKLRAELLALRPVLTAEPPWWAGWRRLGRSAEDGLARRAIAEIAGLEQETVPEYLTYYSPWPDHFAHFKGPFSDEIIAPSGELARLDYWLGRLSAVYRDAGVSNRTLFGMAGDHGLTPVFHVLNPEVEVFDRMRDAGVDLRVVKISSDEGEGPKLTNRLNPPAMRGVDAVVASTAGGNYMIDLFTDQGNHMVQKRLHSGQTFFFENGAVVEFSYNPAFNRLERPLRLAPGIDTLAAGPYGWNEFGLLANTDQSRKVSLNSRWLSSQSPKSALARSV